MLYLIKDNSPLFIHIPVYSITGEEMRDGVGVREYAKKNPTNIIINKHNILS